MKCNYFEYMDMTEKLFYGVPLTNNQLNNVAEKIRQYLVDGGAGEVVKSLGIGFKIVEKQFQTFPELNEVVKKDLFLLTEREKVKN